MASKELIGRRASAVHPTKNVTQVCKITGVNGDYYNVVFSTGLGLFYKTHPIHYTQIRIF